MSYISQKLTRAALLYLICSTVFLVSYLLFNPGIPADLIIILWLLTPDHLSVWYTLVFGLMSIIFSIYVFKTLFGTVKVSTGKGEIVHLSPVLTVMSTEKDKNYDTFETPETGECAVCGKNVFKPFRCPDCKQLLCGKHVLLNDHDCK